MSSPIANGISKWLIHTQVLTRYENAVQNSLNKK